MTTIEHGRGEHHVSNLRSGRIKSTLFSSIVLAYWDNVMGPMISKVWSGNDKVTINDDIISYVSNHTLSGELCRQTEKNTIDPKLYVLQGSGYIFYAVIFNGNSKMGQTISSLTFIMAYKDMERYLLLQEYINKQVKLVVLKYRVLQQKDLKTAVKKITTYLRDFVHTIDSLEQVSVPTKICINETIFGEGEEANIVNLLDSRFLMKSLTSHLQTCGCSIIVGESQVKINLFIRTLALFLSTNERYCSRYASTTSRHLFTADLLLQGVLCDTPTPFASSSKDILLNSYPVTLINVETKTVLQTSQLNEHGVNRQKVIKTELGHLLAGEEGPTCPLSNLFTEDVGDISMMVQKFVTELFILPVGCSIRRNHIENFLSLLKQKALSLVSYIEAKSNKGKEVLSIRQFQQLREDLLLNSEADFRIVLARAEKIRPGVAVFLGADILQKQIQFQGVPIASMWR